MDKPLKLMSLKETADFLGVSIWTLYRWSCKRQIETVKISGRVMVRPESLAQLIESNTRPAAA